MSPEQLAGLGPDPRSISSASAYAVPRAFYASGRSRATRSRSSPARSRDGQARQAARRSCRCRGRRCDRARARRRPGRAVPVDGCAPRGAVTASRPRLARAAGGGDRRRRGRIRADAAIECTATATVQQCGAGVAATWGQPARSAVAAAFIATGLHYATDSYTGVVGQLDGYAARWVTSHEHACMATLVRHEQTEQAMQLRMSCLDARATELRSLVKLLAADTDSRPRCSTRCRRAASSSRPSTVTIRRARRIRRSRDRHAARRRQGAAHDRSGAARAHGDDRARRLVAAKHRRGMRPPRPRRCSASPECSSRLRHASDGETSLHEAILAAERGATMTRPAPTRRCGWSLSRSTSIPTQSTRAIHQAEALLVRVPDPYLEAGLALNPRCYTRFSAARKSSDSEH